MIVAELFAKLGLDIDKGSWEKGDKLLGTFKAGFTAVVAGFGIHKLAGMVEGVAELADAAVKSASKLGITVEAVQELGYAAKLSDISQGELEGSLTKFSRTLEQAKKGSGEAADALKKLGIPMRELKGETLDQNLEVIADAFAKMPDGPQKAALAMQLFGRSGTRLIPLLNGGKEGLVELRNEAHKLGIVVDTETAKKFEEFNDDQTRLSETWRGLKTQVVSALLPALHELVTRLMGWVEAHREIIKAGLTKVIEGLILAFEAFGTIVDYVSDAIDFFIEHEDLAKALMIALTLVMGYFAAAAIAAWVAAAAPVIAFAAAITAVVLAVMDIWKSITTGKGVTVSIFRYLKQLIIDFHDYLASIPGRILSFFVDLGQGIIKAIGDAFDWVVNKAKEAAKAIWSEIKDIPVIGRIASGAEGLLDVVSNQFSSPSSVPSVVASGAAAATATVTNTFDTRMTVNALPGMSAEEIGSIAAKKAAEAQRVMLEGAFGAQRGGKR